MCASCAMIEWSFPSGTRNWRELIPGQPARRIVTLMLLSCCCCTGSSTANNAAAGDHITYWDKNSLCDLSSKTFHCHQSVKPGSLSTSKNCKGTGPVEVADSWIHTRMLTCCVSAYYYLFQNWRREGIASRALLHNQLHHDLVSSPFFSSRQSRKLPRK